MALDIIVLLIALAGLVFYTVLAGADFGAGVWQLLAGSGERGREIREHANRAIGPVWEANHVWLILVLTVVWTGFPVFFGSVFSTLTIPIFLAAIGIVLRGLSYALHSAIDTWRERRAIDTAFSAFSVLTPFMLGTVIGSIGARRVPVGNASGNLVTSWTDSVSVLSGVLSVCTGAFLAAVYLAADAERFSEPEIAAAFHTRALISAVVTGLLALATLIVTNHAAPPLFHGLTRGLGLAAVIVSAVAGVVCFGLVWARRYAVARLAAVVAVAALLLGWAAALRPDLLPGLSLSAASADSATMIAVIIAIAAGGLILFPSLGFLFRLSLAGRLQPDRRGPVQQRPDRADAPRPAWAARAALACYVAGAALLVFADDDPGHVVGVFLFALTALLAFTAVGPDQLAAQPPHPSAGLPQGPAR